MLFCIQNKIKNKKKVSASFFQALDHRFAPCTPRVDKLLRLGDLVLLWPLSVRQAAVLDVTCFLGGAQSLVFCQGAVSDVAYFLRGAGSVVFCQVAVLDVTCFLGGAQSLVFCQVAVSDVAYFS